MIPAAATTAALGYAHANHSSPLPDRHAAVNLDQFLNRLLLTPLAPAAQSLPGQPAAVALVVRERAGLAELLLSRRAGHLRHHPHQICFPGGRQDGSDGTLWATAVRECHEELGLEALSCIARLPPHHTRSGYAVHPFIASHAGEGTLRQQQSEVSDAFWLPLQLLLNSQRYHKVALAELPLPLIFLPTSHGLIWGVTAAILYRLARRLGEEPQLQISPQRGF